MVTQNLLLSHNAWKPSDPERRFLAGRKNGCGVNFGEI
jgi:hypothetical protein